MSATAEQKNVLEETIERQLRDMMASGLQQADREQLDRGEVPARLWQQVEEGGLTSIFVPESQGGFGGGWQDAFALIYMSGFYAVPLPIAETALAKRILVQAGLAPPPGPLALVLAEGAGRRPGGALSGRVTGRATAVPWGGAGTHLVAIIEGESATHAALLEGTSVRASRTYRNIAREPMADLRFDRAKVLATGVVSEDPFHASALVRSVLIAGAVGSLLHQCVAYAHERRQFGKAIGQFQAIQHVLALLAGEAAAVKCAALAACRAADCGDAEFEIAAAKLRANRAVDPATSIAHQVHGAIGFTEECRLHQTTQRLWSWRSDYGNDRYWAGRLGVFAAQRGAAELWPFLTARSDRI